MRCLLMALNGEYTREQLPKKTGRWHKLPDDREGEFGVDVQPVAPDRIRDIEEETLGAAVRSSQSWMAPYATAAVLGASFWLDGERPPSNTHERLMWKLAKDTTFPKPIDNAGGLEELLAPQSDFTGWFSNHPWVRRLNRVIKKFI